MTSASFDETLALRDHREKLLEERRRLDLLIQNVEKTIASKEGRITMGDQDKFMGLKQKWIDDNEKKYGAELRNKYGDERINHANLTFKNMTEKAYAEVTHLEQLIKETLAQALVSGDPSSELAQKTADLHRQWISYYWDFYSKEAHAGLADMYVADERFKAYYDRIGHGAAEFLKEAIHIYCKRKQ
jgi:hypothetical protein